MANSITKEKVTDLQNSNATIHLVDIRTVDEYNQSHVPGAMNISADEINNMPFDKNDIVVCICNHGHKRSQGAADTITALGYTNTFYLEGGTAGWLNDNNIEHHQ